jgi:FolB domain-containing protein
MDKVIIKDLHMQAIIGIRERERITPQDVLINITAFTRNRSALAPDDISSCLDYSELVKLIRSKVTSAQRYTIEALAEDIAALCLDYPQVIKVIVKVEKPGAITGAASAGVEIERRRKGSEL